MTRPRLATRATLVPTFFVLALGAAAGALAQNPPPAFYKSFDPATMGPGSQSRLTFYIDNAESTNPVTDLAFTDTLPAGVVIATPASASTTCGVGVMSAPAGGSTISLSGGSVGVNNTCTVAVNVTSSTPGTHTNTSGDLTSSAGNSGAAQADLTVDVSRPGFRKSFSPASIAVAHVSTLTFTVDNSANPAQASNFGFSDNLPPGVVVADPEDAVTTCGGIVQAAPGTSSISFFTGFVAANASCTVSLDVLGTTAGSHENVTGHLSSSAGDSGFAGAVLDVRLDAVNKTFVDDPAPPGGTVTLRFTLTNFDRSLDLTGITFTDDLDATLSGLVATGLPASDVCGSGSSLSGTSVLTLTGGNLPPGGSCSFDVTLQVPAGASPGTYPNTTSPVDADLGGVPTELPAAGDDLQVVAYPVLTKAFTDDPVTPGSTVTLEFTITSSDASSSATGISFTDDLSVSLPGVVATGLPASGVCGAGSQILGTSALVLTGGTLPPGGSCTFDVVLQVPADAPSGTYPNTTSSVSATVGGTAVIGPPASDDLQVVTAPRLAKSFVGDPVSAGSTVTLRFTLTSDENAPGDATGISFTDDLDAALAGLVAVGLPASDICGVGSLISGSSTLSFTGGSLPAGTSCSFDVTLQVPAGAAPGSHTNTTSEVSATVAGISTTSVPATDDLDVAALTASKSFVDDPVVAGGTVTLSFTLTNLDPTASLTSISFSDDLDGTLSGLVATGLPASDVCGAGSQLLAAGGLLVFSGGSLGPATSCTFDVVLDVPSGASPGVYGNLTSVVSAVQDGNPFTALPAADDLQVLAPLALTKAFTDDPVAPGGTVTLSFTIENQNPSEAATAITFADDLDAALSGLAAVGLPVSDVCGAGSQISGMSLLTFTGGNLPAAGSCTFEVTLQVSAAVSLGSPVVNTTSSVTGTVGGAGATGAPASDTLLIADVGFSKAFAGPVGPGGSTTLTFNLHNLDATSAASGLSFLDDLGAVVPGLVATGLPLADVCGAGSQVTGTSTITFAGGSLDPGGSCSFDVTVEVPPAASPGSFSNTTSDLLANGLRVSEPAVANLTVEPLPSFAKVFAPGVIGAGGISTLTFTIDNTGSTTATTGLAFTDNLPAGMVVAAPPNASTTCTGGAITAAEGAGTVSYGGGSVAAGATCTVQVDVTAADPGSYANTSGQLSSSLGSSGSANATLQVEALPVLGKAFSPTVLVHGGTATMTITVDNSAGSMAVTGLAFTDALPSGMVVASPPNASTTCTGGTLIAAAGSGIVTYSGGAVAAGSSCTVQVDVAVAGAGTYDNTTSNLSSVLGASAPATATLLVAAAGIPVLRWWGILLLVGVLAGIGSWLLMFRR